MRRTSFLAVYTDLGFFARANPNLDLPKTTSEGLRLLSLPNEVLAMICAENILSAKDLAAMRFTNKELHPIATNVFAQRYLQDPFVMMLTGSLETLVEICEHPVFGPHVRKIQLLNNFINPSVIETCVEEMEDAYQTKDIPKLELETRRLQRCTSIIADQYGLLQSGAGLELLRKVFRILKGPGKTVAVASQKFKSSCPPIGWRNITKDFCKDPIDGMHEMILGEPEVTLTIKSLLEAAQASACAISGLEIDVACFGYDTGEQLASRDIDSSLLLGLQNFSFQFQWESRDVYNDPLAWRYLDSLLKRLPMDLKTLAVASDLELPETDDEGRPDHVPLPTRPRHDLFTTLRPTALEVMHLGKMLLYQKDLLKFLDAHQKSLKSLTLDGIHLVGEWDQVLRHIAKTLSLEYLKISKARKAIEYRHGSYDDLSVKIESWYSESSEFKNKEEMDQEINMLIELQKAERREKEAAKEAAKQARKRPGAIRRTLVPARRPRRCGRREL